MSNVRYAWLSRLNGLGHLLYESIEDAMDKRVDFDGVVVRMVVVDEAADKQGEPMAWAIYNAS